MAEVRMHEKLFYLFNMRSDSGDECVDSWEKCDAHAGDAPSHLYTRTHLIHGH